MPEQGWPAGSSEHPLYPESALGSTANAFSPQESLCVSVAPIRKSRRAGDGSRSPAELTAVTVIECVPEPLTAASVNGLLHATSRAAVDTAAERRGEGRSEVNVKVGVVVQLTPSGPEVMVVSGVSEGGRRRRIVIVSVAGASVAVPRPGLERAIVNVSSAFVGAGR